MDIAILSRSDIKFFTITNYITTFFAVTPWYNFERKRLRQPRACKLLACLWATILIFGKINFFQNNKSENHHVHQNFLLPTQHILLEISHHCVFVFNISNLYSAIFKQHNWENMYRYFQNLDEILGNKNKKEMFWYKNYHLQFFIFIVVYCSYEVYSTYIWVEIVGIATYKNAVQLKIFRLAYFLYNISVINIVLAVYIRYEDINKLLRHILWESKIEFDESFIVRMQKINKLYLIIYDLTQEFNEIFGILVLMHVMLAFSDFLISITNSIYSISEVHRVTYTTFLITNILQSILVMFSGGMFIAVCHSSMMEAGKLLNLCHKVENNLQHNTKEKQELRKLTKTAKFSQPLFSAAGCFDVDRRTFFNFLSMAITDLIVIVQFNNSYYKKDDN